MQMDSWGELGVAVPLPFPVSVEPGAFRERAERSAGQQPMGKCEMGRKLRGGHAKKLLLGNPSPKLEALLRYE